MLYSMNCEWVIASVSLRIKRICKYVSSCFTSEKIRLDLSSFQEENSCTRKRKRKKDIAEAKPSEEESSRDEYGKPRILGRDAGGRLRKQPRVP